MSLRSERQLLHLHRAWDYIRSSVVVCLQNVLHGAAAGSQIQLPQQPDDSLNPETGVGCGRAASLELLRCGSSSSFSAACWLPALVSQSSGIHWPKVDGTAGRLRLLQLQARVLLKYSILLAKIRSIISLFSHQLRQDANQRIPVRVTGS